MQKTIAAGALTMLLAASAYAGSANDYLQTNLTSDLPGVAKNQDTSLVNPWGLTALPGSPFWTSNNGTGTSTLYTGTGAKIPLTVTLNAPAGQSDPASPTGIVGNGGAGFGGDPFIFDTEAGQINGWKPGVTVAPIVASGASGSIYKGLAIGSSAAGDTLYAANFGLGRIDVYDTNFKATSVSGSFKDPNLPTGYSPFNVQNLNGQLYVAYAKSTGGKDEQHGAGLGIVDVFDLNGHFVKRLASNGGALDAPWGLALAPSTFGAFGGDLLVGNFGDGLLNAYDPVTGMYRGDLTDMSGKAISIAGLWGISFGNGVHDQGTNVLYFNAGIPGPGNVEDHGLFGSLTAVPEPGALGTAGLAIVLVSLAVKRRRLQVS